MRTITTVSDLRQALGRARDQGQTIGLVPTMGAFHAGHLSLMRRAREECDHVVVSLFVNPPQFDDAGDLEHYPRDEARDRALAAEAGVDTLFAPSVEEVYPSGFSTSVVVRDQTETLEGTCRGPEHFEGVATIVSKLFNIVAPDVAYFGQKDAQQAFVIKRLVNDRHFPVRVEVCPTIREPDGLASSSRNVRLPRAERPRATALRRALDAATTAVAEGVTDAQEIKARAASELHEAEIEPDYLEIVCAETFEPLSEIDREALALVAARVGDTRLIDNQLLSPALVATAPARVSATGRH